MHVHNSCFRMPVCVTFVDFKSHWCGRETRNCPTYPSAERSQGKFQNVMTTFNEMPFNYCFATCSCGHERLWNAKEFASQQVYICYCVKKKTLPWLFLSPSGLFCNWQQAGISRTWRALSRQLIPTKKGGQLCQDHRQIFCPLNPLECCWNWQIRQMRQLNTIFRSPFLVWNVDTLERTCFVMVESLEGMILW